MQRIECKRNNYSKEIKTIVTNTTIVEVNKEYNRSYIKKLKQQQFPLDRVLSLSSPKTVMMSTSCFPGLKYPYSRPTLAAICTVCVCVVTVTLS